VDEVEFQESVTVSDGILNYVSTKWNGFHGSMKKVARNSPKRDAVRYQDNFLGWWTIYWMSWRTLIFYMHMASNGRSRNWRKKRSSKNMRKWGIRLSMDYKGVPRRMLLPAFHSFSQLYSPTRKAGESSAASSFAAASPDLEID
jgi:hypothetical protein